MKKIKFPYWLRIFKWPDLTILVTTVLLLAYALIDSTNLIDGIIPSGFAGQIIYAIYTAVLTAVIFAFYSRLSKRIKNKKLFGYWAVLKFDGLDNYKLDSNYVIISEGSEVSALHYLEEDTSNLNSKKGIIYIDPNNIQTGQLIQTLDWLNQTSTIYPTYSYRIFFDSETYLSKGKEPIIRIMDHSGDEIMILQKPTDQTAFKSYINNKLSITMESMATPIDDLLGSS